MFKRIVLAIIAALPFLVTTSTPNTVAVNASIRITMPKPNGHYYGKVSKGRQVVQIYYNKSKVPKVLSTVKTKNYGSWLFTGIIGKFCFPAGILAGSQIQFNESQYTGMVNELTKAQKKKRGVIFTGYNYIMGNYNIFNHFYLG